MSIVHSVFFNLKHPVNGIEEAQFFEKSFKILSAIPGVNHFSVLNQTSPKCNFKFGFSMVFNSQDEYQAYNDHPDHCSYVEDIWLHEVMEFQEIDYVLHTQYNPKPI